MSQNPMSPLKKKISQLSLDTVEVITTQQLSIDDKQSNQSYPSENQTRSALYIKFNKDKKIEEHINDENHQQQYKFKIKNLDTGEQQEITNKKQQKKIVNKITKGLNKIPIDYQWKYFWNHVQKNNKKLLNCCENGLYDQIIKLIQQGFDGYPVQINCKGLDNWRPIHFACYQGHDDIVRLLIKYHVQINVVTKFNRTPLHITSIRGYLSVTKILCQNNVEINAVDCDGNTALHFACRNGYKQIVKYLISQNCNIIKNKQGHTQIDECCDEEIKKIFIQYGFKEKGDYNWYNQNHQKKIQMIPNKGQSITPLNFIFYKLLGKGSFGEVFLVKKKGQNKFLAMKILSKDKILGKNLKRYALTQRNVMSVTNHPFMVKLHYAFQSSTQLFLVMQYYPGGDLGKLIMKKKKIPEDQAKKYIAQLILAFQALHKNMIIFRDLKPDNVVLDAQGHCILTDFGLSKEGVYNNITDSFCGSVAYLAPEVLNKEGHSRTIDWYLIGLLLYELLAGIPPYYNPKKQVLFENIKKGPLKIPKNVSNQAKDLIKKLLCRDPKKRLGNERDAQEVKQHGFFKDINWQDVFNRKLQMPPVDIPKINQNQTIKMSFNKEYQKKKIQGWTFVNAINNAFQSRK